MSCSPTPTALFIMPMSKFENIEGNKLLSIFQQLISQKILVKLFLTNSDFESLTLVTGTQVDGALQIFRIDAPEGLAAAITASSAQKLSFEFTSSDRVTHRFEAEIDGWESNSVNLRFPLIIQRHQQRDNYRVRVPHDSLAIVTIEDAQIRMKIENLSIGGVLCHCLNRHKTMIREDLELTGMQLKLTHKNESCVILIQRLVVKRIEPALRVGHFGVAFEFIQMKKDAKKLLVQQIYELQRSFLQNRLRRMS
jgi:c-di-GMP-binding flagellar brake protein YcgR